jgi:hypothetical protein
MNVPREEEDDVNAGHFFCYTPAAVTGLPLSLPLCAGALVYSISANHYANIGK